MDLALFTFNPFQENTYVLYDKTSSCVIIDPGMSNAQEQKMLDDFISAHWLTPSMLINTHCHIDHVLGNKYVSEKYDLTLAAHEGERVVLEMQPKIAEMYGIAYDPSPDIKIELKEGSFITFGNTKLEILFTPGHSPASISFYEKQSKTLIAGDVLFQNSIGRTDLPGGDYDTLISTIKSKFFVLDDNVRVYPGHGAATTIGVERKTNPFLI